MQYSRSCLVLDSLDLKPIFSFCRDNILVLDVFFEALNYETIEQKKAYEVAGLLGKFYSRFPLFSKPGSSLQYSLPCYFNSNMSDWICLSLFKKLIIKLPAL